LWAILWLRWRISTAGFVAIEWVQLIAYDLESTTLGTVFSLPFTRADLTDDSNLTSLSKILRREVSSSLESSKVNKVRWLILATINSQAHLSDTLTVIHGLVFDVCDQAAG
jgi:hypothetical protein